MVQFVAFLAAVIAAGVVVALALLLRAVIRAFLAPLRALYEVIRAIG